MDGRWNPAQPDMPGRLRHLGGRVARRGRSPLAVLIAVAIVAAVLAIAMIVSLSRTSGAGQDGTVAAGASASTPDDESSPTEPVVSTPTRPTKFGAWWAKEGKYEAKWEAPESIGNSPVTEYVVKDCDGKELKRVNADTFHVEISQDHLDCMTVQAVNADGEGEKAQFGDIVSG